MRTMFAYMAAAAALAAPVAAQAAPACLTDAEARSVVAFALPTVVATLARRCGPSLPAGSWLVRNGAGLASRYRSQGGGDMRAAVPVLERLTGQQMPDFLDPATGRGVVEGVIANQMATLVRPADCPALARITEQLSPLPIGNVAALVVALIQLDRGRVSRTGISICPAARG